MKFLKKIKNKKILVTAGSVWVPLDKVRVITNIFSGRLGVNIAELAHKMGGDVTILLGPGNIIPSILDKKRFHVIKYRYFDELLKLMTEELQSGKYDIIVHSAAVSDYYVKNPPTGKIKSGKKTLTLTMFPTIKIIDLIKKIAPNVFLVKFKLEVGVGKKKLMEIAYKSMMHSKADLIVANEFKTISQGAEKHIGFIMDTQRKIQQFTGKNEIAQGLLETINLKLD